MLGSLLLSSPADAEPEGPKELLAPDTPVLAGRVGYSERVRADHREKRGHEMGKGEREYDNRRTQRRKQAEREYESTMRTESERDRENDTKSQRDSNKGQGWGENRGRHKIIRLLPWYLPHIPPNSVTIFYSRISYSPENSPL